MADEHPNGAEERYATSMLECNAQADSKKNSPAVLRVKNPERRKVLRQFGRHEQEKDWWGMTAWKK